SRKEDEKAGIVLALMESQCSKLLHISFGPLEILAARDWDVTIDRGRPQLHVAPLEQRDKLGQGVLRLMRMQHLVAKPRTREGLLHELRVQTPILGEHCVFGSTSRLHLSKMVEERTPTIGVIETDEYVATWLHERSAEAFNRAMAVVCVMQHAQGYDEV